MAISDDQCGVKANGSFVYRISPLSEKTLGPQTGQRYRHRHFTMLISFGYHCLQI